MPRSGCINRTKQWRAVATSFESRAVRYCATVTTAAHLMNQTQNPTVHDDEHQR
jgi:hypothetical protein